MKCIGNKFKKKILNKTGLLISSMKKISNKVSGALK